MVRDGIAEIGEVTREEASPAERDIGEGNGNQNRETHRNPWEREEFLRASRSGKTFPATSWSCPSRF